MEQDRIEIMLPAELARSARSMASADDVTVGQLLRDLLAREISRRSRARPPVRADERLVAPLRARLAGDLAHARNWDDLQRRLTDKGYILREAGGGLALHDWPGDRRICKASELGFSYGRLLRRFDAPFPGHGHRWLYERFRAEASRRGPDDIAVVEPFD